MSLQMAPTVLSSPIRVIVETFEMDSFHRAEKKAIEEMTKTARLLLAMVVVLRWKKAMEAILLKKMSVGLTMSVERVVPLATWQQKKTKMTEMMNVALRWPHYCLVAVVHEDVPTECEKEVEK